MAVTSVLEVTDQIQKKWAPMFMQELRESLLLGALVNKDYDGVIGTQGDTVRVSQLAAPTGQLRTVGTDADTFDSEQMVWSKVDVVADKRAVASFEVAELAQIQSQLDSPEGQSEMRNALMFAVQQQVNDYLWGLTSPSTSAPDHLLTSEASLTAAKLQAIRTLAAQAKWAQAKGWYGLVDPVYYGNLLSEATLVSQDYVPGEAPVIGGQLANRRYGFNILEDNSRTSARGLFFSPDYMLMVMQKQPQFKISDLHSQKKFGYLISVDLIFGAKLGPDGAKKHIYQTAAATNNAGA
jgi:hypothetical protein